MLFVMLFQDASSSPLTCIWKMLRYKRTHGWQ